jgi:hypothetical protein
MENQTGSAGNFTAKIKLFSGPGTRQWPRFPVADIPSIRSIHSNAGSEIKVANISRGGALLRTHRRMAPCTRIQLNFELAECTIQLTAAVLRSSISSQEGRARYQAAVAFDRPLQFSNGQRSPATDTMQEPVFRSFQFEEFFSESSEFYYKPVQDRDSAMIAAFFALGVRDPQDALREMTRLNDW